MPAAPSPRTPLRRPPYFIALLIVLVAASVLLYVFSGDRAEEASRSASLPIAPTPPSPEVSVPAESAPKPASELLPGAIAGTVRWFDTKQPVPEIYVKAEAEGVDTLETVTDEHGGFVFEDVPPNIEFTLRAQGPEYGPYTVRSLRARVSVNKMLEGQDLTVWPGRIISGSVVRVDPVINIRDGVPVPGGLKGWENSFQVPPAEKPLPGVQVQLIREDRSGERRIVAETTSDNNGRFEFPPAPSGPYFVNVVAPPDAIVQAVNRSSNMVRVGVSPELSPPDPVKIVFKFGGLGIEGRVLDGEGQPIKGASVKAAPMPPLDGGEGHLGMVEAITDAEGRYLIQGLASASIRETLLYHNSGQFEGSGNAYIVTAQATGFAPREISIPMVTAPMVAAVQNVLRDADRERPQNAGRPGSRRPNPVPESKGHTIRLPDLQLEREASITGHVEDTSAQLVANAGMLLRRYPYRDMAFLQPGPGAPPDSFQTDSDGQFRLGSLPSGNYGFIIIDPKTGATEPNINPPLRVNAGDQLENVTIVITGPEARAAIRGQVVDAATRAPVEQFNASVERIHVATDERNPVPGIRSQEPLAPGEFLVQRISPGRAELQVSTEGYPTHWRSVEVVAGEETEVTIKLSRGAAIEGRVTRNGRAVHHAYLSMRRIDADFESQQNGTQTDAEGVFRLDNLEPAEYEIRVSMALSDKLDQYAWAKVQLKAGETSRIDFHLDGNGRIQGTLSLPKGYERAFVWVRDARNAPPILENGKIVPWQPLIANVKLTQSGPFVIEGLPPGDYSVVGLGVRPRVIPNGTTSAKDYVPVEKYVTVRDGRAAQVDLAIP